MSSYGFSAKVTCAFLAFYSNGETQWTQWTLFESEKPKYLRNFDQITVLRVLLKLAIFIFECTLGFTYNFAYSPFNVTIESKQKQYTDQLQYDSF